MKEVGLSAVKLIIGLVVGASFQLGLLFIETILSPETDEAVQPD